MHIALSYRGFPAAAMGSIADAIPSNNKSSGCRSAGLSQRANPEIGINPIPSITVA
jgi:hypothetical protein